MNSKISKRLYGFSIIFCIYLFYFLLWYLLDLVNWESIKIVSYTVNTAILFGLFFSLSNEKYKKFAQGGLIAWVVMLIFSVIFL